MYERVLLSKGDHHHWELYFKNYDYNGLLFH